MSTQGVTDRMTTMITSAVAENRAVTAAEFKEVVNYANAWNWGEWGLSDNEKKALLQPGSYLEAAGIDLSKVRFDSDALEIAQQLAQQTGLRLFPKMPDVSAALPTPDAPAETTVRDAFAKAMARGTDLGTYETWKVRTAGADVSFKTEGAGKSWPALVIQNPTFVDPEPQDIAAKHAEAIGSVKTAAELKEVLEKVVADEQAYFVAEGVDVRDVNEGFGISNLRRKAFVSALNSVVRENDSLSAQDKVAAKGVIEGINIQLATGRDFEMKVGSHKNYWPYWDNYLPPLEKMLAQTEEGSAAHAQIMNRIRDIHRRKSAHNRSINERDFEKSIGMALVHSPMFSEGVGHRVSVAEGSTPFDPNYELLSVATSDLPEGFENYAGMQVVRADDGKLVADYMGEGDSDLAVLAKSMVGKEIPAELAEKIEAKALTRGDLGDLNMRDFVTGESARKDISMDWDSNGAINVAVTSISWWGHCHNEAPLNVKGIDPQKAVTIYRAARGVDVDKALVNYTAEDAWDVAGAFTADHEDGYSVGNTGRSARVDSTSFVGIRMDGKNTFTLKLPNGSVEVDAGLSRFEKEGKSYGTDALFRSNVEKEDGTFEANPFYVSTSAREGDLITIDVNDAKMSMQAKYVTFDSQGYRVEKKSRISIDPTKDEFVKLSEEISSRDPSGLGGEIVEHYYNAKTKEYHSVTKTVSKGEDGTYAADEEGVTSENVTVDSLTHTSETKYDSAEELFDFYMDNPGLPKTYDTSSGKAVWNYPVNRESMNLLKEVTQEENGQTVTYRTYNLKYDTMGGPSGDSKFILKYNAAGKVIDEVAIDAMPDFVYRNDHWVSAPIATDLNGRTVFNAKALNKGYLLHEGGDSYDDVETALWRMEATVLYASLTDETAADHAYVFETEEGKLLSFANEADFNAAVEADKALRSAQ